jgi:glyoxylase-like metal-dependent hydrolase (beta-lactamase superfamily II)
VSGEDAVTDADAEAAALADARDQGIHWIPLPTPFAIGDVNTYLIEDDPLTLVDCGPNSATTVDALDSGLKALGHSIEEIGLLVLTHQHADHAGLAAHLQRHAGTEIACFGPLIPYLADWHGQLGLADEDARALMVAHGVPREVAETLRSVARLVAHWGAAAQAAVGLEDQGTVALRDRTLRVHHLPGHSPSDLVLVDEASGLAFAGDHLLARTSSNALVTRPLTGPTDRRPASLLAYRHSLSATRELDLSLILAGHGPPITDHRSLITYRLERQQVRADRFHEFLADGPLSAHEIALREWGDIAFTQTFLTISEVLGSLDLLIEEGNVIEERDRDPIVFRQAQSL